jgi:DNA repair exonuclease SbcCD nuclease subunit
VKLAHLADIHLGFRQYHRLTSQGINQREADVARAFRLVIDDVIEAAPDIVVIAGDLFNSVRPSNPAILHSFNQFRRLRLALPEAPVVIVAGNHDTPRSIETGTILKLFEAVGGVHVVAEEPRDLLFEELDLSVTCVPHVAWLAGSRPTLTPPGGAKYQVAVTHGEVAGVLPRDAGAMEYGGAILEPAEINAERWSYVALGHYHVAHKVRDNAWYSGALEYVSPNPWGELKDEAREGREGQKGWLLVNLAGGAAVEFRPISLARRLVDFEPLHAAGLSADEIDAYIRKQIEGVKGGIEDQVVRQVVFDVPRPIARDLDHAAIRGYKASALHYHLDLRRPRQHREVGVAAPGQRQTLADVLNEYLGRRPLDADVDRDRLVALGRTYMDQVEQAQLEE